ncbi:MAG TPA: hypothetical protein PLP25_00625 [Candidatus Limiplasma sp.]|nr:hypothetical protein [Candidatus Limiplasma sp.]HPS80347.1 hypothetical protein [Candidatus Limiplasma sp.]
MKKWFLILLALTLPVTGAIAQENQVVALPTVAPVSQVAVTQTADYSLGSMAEYYASTAVEGDDYQSPQMTADEKSRAKTLLTAYQAGERPASSVLNKLDNVVVGVYALKPEDYEGVTLYVLLPVNPLTDEQILEVIDAFAACGQTFDPDALSFQNCMRGGGSSSSRYMQEEERDRSNVLRDLYIREGFTSKAAFTPLVSDDGLGLVTLDADAYCGLDKFPFFPARAMTDDELLSYIIYTEEGDPTEYGHYAAYEKQLRLELTRLVGAPMVLTRQDENMGVMGDFDTSYDDEKVYCASFMSMDGTNYWGCLDVDTNQMLSGNVSKKNNLLYSDLHLNPFDPKWLDIAKATVAKARGDNMAIRTAESCGEVWLSEAGFGVLVNVIMADGSYYAIQLAYQDESVYDVFTYDSHTPNLEKMYPDGSFD